MQCLCGSVCHLGTPTASGSVVTDQRWLTYRHFHQANSMQWCCWVGLESSVRQIYTDKIYICTTICSCAVTTIPVSLLTLLNSVQVHSSFALQKTRMSAKHQAPVQKPALIKTCHKYKDSNTVNWWWLQSLQSRYGMTLCRSLGILTLECTALLLLFFSKVTHAVGGKWETVLGAG